MLSTLLLDSNRYGTNADDPLDDVAGPHELRPSDVLIERFQAWKRLVKNLIAYFEGIADIEVSSSIFHCSRRFDLTCFRHRQSNTAKELTQLGGVIQVPFREGNQFLGEGGVQDIFYGVVRRSVPFDETISDFDFVRHSERRLVSSPTTTPISPRRSKDPSCNTSRSSEPN